jgi:hypothetical protein
MEQELKFRKMQIKKIVTIKPTRKKLSQEEICWLEKEKLRIILKENQIAENEKRKYFSKVLSSCIQKMEDCSTQNSFYLKPEQLMKIASRPQIVIVQNILHHQGKGKKSFENSREKRGKEFTK